MHDAVNKLAPIRITDERFDVNNIDRYVLAIQADLYSLKIFVFDNIDNRAVAFEEHKFGNDVKSLFQLTLELKRIYDSHPYITAGFWSQINLLVKSGAFTLVPDFLFSDEALSDFGRIIESVETDYQQLSVVRQMSFDVVNVFYADKTLLQWFKAAHPTVDVHLFHPVSTSIEGLVRTIGNKGYIDKQVAIFVRNHRFDLLVIRDGKIDSCNHHVFKNEYDIVYFVVLSIKQASFNVKQTSVLLYGDFEPGNQLFELLQKYFPLIKLGNRPSGINFGYVFDELPEFSNFELFSSVFFNK